MHSNVDIGNIPEIEITSEVSLNTYMEGASIVQYIKKKDAKEYSLLGELPLGEKDTTISLKAKNIELWDIDKPVLYMIKSQLKQGDKVLDEKIITTGFRKIEFRKDGFYLNNRKVKIRGLNRHQSYPYVGYAMPESMQRLDADILKYELGLNLLELLITLSPTTLSIGVMNWTLVFTEPGWQHIASEWKEQAIKNTRDMVLRIETVL